MVTGYGASNSNWRGGRTITHDGYVAVYVGSSHHLARQNGYAVLHRVVAEKKLGRRLKPDEVVHHVNGDKQDNRPENLEVYPNNGRHVSDHMTTATARAMVSVWNRRKRKLIEAGDKSQYRVCDHAVDVLVERGITEFSVKDTEVVNEIARRSGTPIHRYTGSVVMHAVARATDQFTFRYGYEGRRKYRIAALSAIASERAREGGEGE